MTRFDTFHTVEISSGQNIQAYGLNSGIRALTNICGNLEKSLEMILSEEKIRTILYFAKNVFII